MPKGGTMPVYPVLIQLSCISNLPEASSNGEPGAHFCPQCSGPCQWRFPCGTCTKIIVGAWDGRDWGLGVHVGLIMLPACNM